MDVQSTHATCHQVRARFLIRTSEAPLLPTTMSGLPPVASSSSSSSISGPTSASSYASPAPALWAHLLRRPLLRDSISQSKSRTNATGTSLPPPVQLAPVDKNAASTRILLHDTHAQLEIFTERSGKLMVEVEQARRELSKVGEMFEGEREGLVDDMVKLGT